MRGVDDSGNEKLEQLRSAAEAAAGLLALTEHMPVPLEQRRPAVATWRRVRDALTAAGVEVPESTRPAEPWALVSYRELRDLRAQHDAVLALHRPVKFTNVELGIVDADVCFICHSRLDKPEDWPEDQEWPYPLVQDAYPCQTVRLLRPN